jgi:hypothetical protein
MEAAAAHARPRNPTPTLADIPRLLPYVLMLFVELTPSAVAQAAAKPAFRNAICRDMLV